MIVEILKYFMKYIVFGIILFLLVTYIPINQIKTTDQIIIYVVAIISFVIIDIILNYQSIMNYCGIFKKYRKPINSNCGCVTVEKFESTPQNPLDTTQLYTTPNSSTLFSGNLSMASSNSLTLGDLTKNSDNISNTNLNLNNSILNPVSSSLNINNPTVTNVEKEAETSNEMKYTELPPEMHQPLGTYDNTFTNDFNHGYTMLNTDKWSVPMRRPPVCIQEKECPVCPSMTSGSLMNVKDFPMETKIPEKINMEYVQDKINKTRI